MKNVAVIGLGTMGPGIAATLARAGMKVTAFDADPEKRAKAGQGFAAAAAVLSALAVPDWPLSFGQIFPPMVGGGLSAAGAVA